MAKKKVSQNPPAKSAVASQTVAYERHKQQAAERQAEKSRQGREVGEIPSPKNAKLRERCRLDLKLFMESYCSHKFKLTWSKDHLKAIKKAQRAILEGGLFALAMPRGSGKTTIFECAILWAVIYGHHKYALLVLANQKLSKNSINNIKKLLEDPKYNQALVADFPEVCIPIQRLERIANRANGQTHNGEATGIVWGKEIIVFATIAGSAASGGIIQAGAVKSAVRGANVGGLRPSLCLLDDPQTKTSAKSDLQTDEREEIVSGDVLGLAGPGESITALMACTVIRPGKPGCLAARFLDRKRHPEWQGERHQILYKFPDHMELWYEYRELIADAQNRDCSPDEVRKIANAFYRKNRTAMEAGADVAWPDRKPDCLSGLQFAMNLFFRDEAAFWAEYMNQPQERSSSEDEATLTADEIARQVNQLGRGCVPLQAQHITAFIDVHKDLLFWMICWWAEDFTGGILDYGTWPDQGRLQFKLRDASPTLRKATGQKSMLAAVRAALDKLSAELLRRRFMRDDGLEMQIERLGEDANWGEATDTVYEHAREHAQKAIIRPCHGKGLKVTDKPMSEWKVPLTEKAGFHWIRKTGSRAMRFLVVDSNHWKSFCHAGLSLPFEERHSISLYKAPAHEHRLLAEHCSSESRKTAEHKGRSVDLWEPKPTKPDNHWWDTLVGCAVMASELGVVWRATTLPQPPPTRPSGPRKATYF